MTATTRRHAAAPPPEPPTPGGLPMRPFWWQAQPGKYVDAETVKLERHNSPKGRLRRQEKFYRDDPAAPCTPEPWEPEYGRQLGTATDDAARAA
jgi:hypothetical protein